MSDRCYDFDVLCVIVMLLGIVFYVVLFFLIIFWIVNDICWSEVFDVLFVVIYGFWMLLFFVLSGFFMVMLWCKCGFGGFVV